MLLLGLTGLRGGGKLAVAQHLAEQHNFVHLRFDDPVKDMLAALLQLAREQIDLLLQDPQWRETPLPHINVSPSQLLRSLTTDWGRRDQRDLWIDLLRQRLNFIVEDLPYEYEGIVISDVRFDNEAHFVRESGTLVHVAKPELEPDASFDLVKFQYGDQILLNLGASFIGQHTDNLLETLRRRCVA